MTTLNVSFQSDPECEPLFNFTLEKNTVKFLNFRTPENFAVFYLKFKQKAQTFGHFAKKMKIE